MKAKLKNRLANVKRALHVRIIVNDDDIIEDNQEDQFIGENGLVEEEEDIYDDFVFGALKSKLRMRMWGDEGVPPPPVPPTPPTIVEEEDEDGEEEGCGTNEPASASSNEGNDDHSVASSAGVFPQPPSAQETRRAKSLINALNCGGRSRSNNAAIPVLPRDDGSSSTRRTAASTSARSIRRSTIVSTYGEECNICLSQFQVGDSAAWSLRYRREGNEKDEICVKMAWRGGGGDSRDGKEGGKGR
jgi:hypothetical protein